MKTKTTVNAWIWRMLLLGCMSGTAFTAYGQTTTKVPLREEYTIPLKAVPVSLENYLSAAYFNDSKSVYNLRSNPMSSVLGDIVSFKVNPSGTTYAILSTKNEKSKVEIYDLWEKDELLHRFKKMEQATAISFSSDAKSLYITTPNQLLCYDARSYEQRWSMEMPIAAKTLCASANGYFLAASDGAKVIIVNLDNRQVRKTFDLDVKINDIGFSAASDLFAILTDDSSLSLYDTKSFLISQSFENMGQAKALAFHPNGKYVSVITDEGRITIQNLLDTDKSSSVEQEAKGISFLKFIRDNFNITFLTYSSNSNLIYKYLKLDPNYTQLLKDELDERMSEWLKQMPGESLEEYNIRVNEETRLQKMKLFEEEIATRLAGDGQMQMASITLGNYNPESSMLALQVGDMPTIFLNVPENEVLSFSDAGNLQLLNTRYGLTAQDNFELVYTEVYNKETGKTYVFDNRERRSLEFLKSDDSFVPLELIQQSNMELQKLEEIKEDVINLAKKQELLSDHTQISVDAKVVTAVNADGKKILNYNVNFTYEVEPQFSAHEDFAPGKYKAAESSAATSLLSIVKQAFEKDFAQYVKPGKKLQVNITGMADALPINGVIAYDGCYGDFEGEPVYKNGDLSNITVTKKGGITKNEQLAFLRATGVKEYIKANVPSLNEMDTNYVHYLEIDEGNKGGAYRRIKVDFVFVDAF